jgi:hypothetical protein
MVKIGDSTALNSDFVSLLTTALSIMILVFSQVEYSNDYNLKAEKYHECAKEIADLFYELRETQYNTDPTLDKQKVFRELRIRYTQIIARNDNHSNLDYFRFILQRPKDYSVSFRVRMQFYIKEYLSTQFIYHLLIVVPVIIFLVYFIQN